MKLYSGPSKDNYHFPYIFIQIISQLAQVPKYILEEITKINPCHAK